MGSEEERKKKKKPGGSSQFKKPTPNTEKPKAAVAKDPNERIRFLEGKLTTLTKMVEELQGRRLLEKDADDKRESVEIPSTSKTTTGTQPKTSQHLKTKPRSFTWNSLDLFTQSVHPKYFQIHFENDLKRTISPFEIISEIETTTEININKITSLNRSDFVIRVEPSETNAEKLSLVTSIQDVPCTITPSSVLNSCKGIIYIEECNLSSEVAFGDLKEYLIEDNPTIINVELASFIKPRKPNTYAVLLTFSTPKPQYSIYIPGERQDSRVYPFHNKPMHCRKCQHYGHTYRKCKSIEERCQNCSQNSHSAKECNSDVICCFNCRGSHSSGSRTCPVYIKELEILRIQKEEGVSIPRARQILNGITAETPIERSTKNLKYDLTFSEEDKRSFSPRSIEKCLERLLHGRPKSIRTTSNTTYCVELASPLQVGIIRNAKFVGSLPVVVEENKKNFGHLKGIVYITEYNMMNFEKYKTELLKRLPITDAQPATWMKPKNPRANALLLTFNTDDLPLYIDIPGEQALTAVFEQKPRPMLCKQCLQFGHTKKHCNSTETVCQKCSQKGHTDDECNSNEDRCLHCQNAHRTGFRNCKVFQYECEILSIQLTNRIPRRQAQLIFDKQHPHFKTLNYQEAARKEKTEVIKEKSLHTVVCQSPRTGRHFETEVELENSVQTVQIPAEQWNIIKKRKDTNTEEDESLDRSMYENELRKSARTLNTTQNRTNPNNNTSIPFHKQQNPSTSRDPSHNRKRRPSESPSRSMDAMKRNKKKYNY